MSDGSTIATMHFAGPDDTSPLHMISEQELADLRAIRDASVAHVNASKAGKEEFAASFRALYLVLKEKYG